MLLFISLKIESILIINSESYQWHNNTITNYFNIFTQTIICIFWQFVNEKKWGGIKHWDPNNKSISYADINQSVTSSFRPPIVWNLSFSDLAETTTLTIWPLLHALGESGKRVDKAGLSVSGIIAIWNAIFKRIKS